MPAARASRTSGRGTPRVAAPARGAQEATPPSRARLPRYGFARANPCGPGLSAHPRRRGRQTGPSAHNSMTKGGRHARSHRRTRPERTMSTKNTDAGAPAPAPLLAIPIAEIEVEEGHNPRTEPDPEAQAALEASIRQVGILQPVLVRTREHGAGYVLVAG